MRKLLILSVFIMLFGGIFSNVLAQSDNVGIKPNFVGGEVTSISENKIVLQTKDGAIEAVLSNKTEYKRVPPDNPSLKSAIASNLTEVAIGDKLLITGVVSADKKTIPAKAVYLLTKSDIAQKQSKETEKWQTRGVSGRVTAVNPQTKQITISTRGVMGERATVVSLKDETIFRRYAPDSVSFGESKISSISEIQTGDMIRALGDKNADGSTLSAEEIVTGSFQTVGGTVTAIDTAKNEITINNLQTKKDVTIIIGKNSVLKQFPAAMAQRMAQFQMMQAGGMQPGQGGMRPPRGNPPNAPAAQPAPGENPNQMVQGRGQGGMRGGGGNIDDMLERFPNITIENLKVGDMIAVSSTKSANQERITAIKLLSGVEPFLKMQQASGQNQGGRRSQDTGFSIPGLEGGGAP
jgi:ribosomal protein L24